MNSPGINPAVSGMIAFYSVAFYRLFDEIGLDKAREVANRASEISGEHALQYESNQGIEYELPHVPGKVSPGRVLAAMSAFVVWQQKLCKVDYFPESVFLSAALDGYKLYEIGKNFGDGVEYQKRMRAEWEDAEWSQFSVQQAFKDEDEKDQTNPS